MKSLPYSTSLAVFSALAVAINLSATVSAESDDVGKEQQCLQLSHIDQSPAIDDRTILIEMRGDGGYKRIDLATSCPGLMFSSFINETRIDRLCTSDTLQVAEAAGAVCAISKITTINETEAKELRSKR